MSKPTLPVNIRDVEANFLKSKPKTLADVAERLARAIEAAVFAIDVNEDYGGDRSVDEQAGVDSDAWSWCHQAHKDYRDYLQANPTSKTMANTETDDLWDIPTYAETSKAPFTLPSKVTATVSSFVNDQTAVDRNTDIVALYNKSVQGAYNISLYAHQQMGGQEPGEGDKLDLMQQVKLQQRELMVEKLVDSMEAELKNERLDRDKIVFLLNVYRAGVSLILLQDEEITKGGQMSFLMGLTGLLAKYY